MEAQNQIHATTAVYLFAEQFAEPAKGIMVQGAVAPRSGSKVNVKTLVLNLYMAALMELVESGAARIETVEVRKLLGKETVPALALTGSTPGSLSAIAAKMVLSIQAGSKPEHRRVREVIIRMVGGRGSTHYPWLLSLAPVIGQAEVEGYIQLPEKKPGLLKAMFNPTESMTGAKADAARTAAHEAEVEGVRRRLAAFEQSLGALAASLRKEINSGVEECTERSSD
jgi:hypothetical protein